MPLHCQTSADLFLTLPVTAKVIERASDVDGGFDGLYRVLSFLENVERPLQVAGVLAHDTHVVQQHGHPLRVRHHVQALLKGGEGALCVVHAH